MAPPPISLIEDLSHGDMKKLTQLLVLPMAAPHDAWLQEQSELIATLPSKLKRPESFLPRLAMSLPFGKDKAHLCPSHKHLNPHLIRRIFLQVSAECTTRLARLVSNPYLPPEIAIHVRTLQKVNSLWMASDLYRYTFQCQPHDERFDRIASDCEACILAVVGGNIGILRELRASMLGRKKKRGVSPRLLPLVESWIEGTGAEAIVLEHSCQLARKILHCRKQMQEARRQLRRNAEQGILDPAPPEMSSRRGRDPRSRSEDPTGGRDPFQAPVYVYTDPEFPDRGRADDPYKDSLRGQDPFRWPAYEYSDSDEKANHPSTDSRYGGMNKNQEDTSAPKFNDPFANRAKGQRPFPPPNPYAYEDHDETEHEIEPEGSIVNFYAHHLSSSNILNPNHNSNNNHDNNKTTQAQNEAKIHPAFRESVVFQYQTNGSSFTIPEHNNPFHSDRDDDKNEHDQDRYHPLPPRPGNPIAYSYGGDDDHHHSGLSPISEGSSGRRRPPPPAAAAAADRGASARVRQPPPAAYNNRANARQQQMSSSSKRATAYTASVYSQPGIEDEEFHQVPPPPPPSPSPLISQMSASRRGPGGDESLGEEGEYVPARRGWNIKDGEMERETERRMNGNGMGMGMSNDGYGDDREMRKRDTKFTSFGAFI